MQNANNLRSVLPTPPGGKVKTPPNPRNIKKKNQIQKPAYKKPNVPNPSKKPELSWLLAPQQETETTELLDDKTPSIPLPTGEWKPVGVNSGLAGGTTNLSKAQKKGRFSWVNPNQANVEMSKNLTSVPSGQGVHWELNQIDEKDDPEPEPPKQETEQATDKTVRKPLVLKGFASQIMFGTQGKQSTVAKTQDLPATKPKSTIDNVATTAPKVSSPIPQPTTKLVNPKRLGPPPPRQNTDTFSPNPFTPMMSAPAKGVPRSFYSGGALGAIQPQDSPYLDWVSPIPAIYEPQQTEAMSVQTDYPVELPPQQYSPSDVYSESIFAEQNSEEESEPEQQGEHQGEQQGGQKRLSAFQRLGPLTQPKKPKLTINLLCNKTDREVVDPTESEDQYTPVHLRKDIRESTDDTVVKFLPVWPWKKNFGVRKTVTARTSKTAMMLELEQMEEAYDKDQFFQVTVKGYPLCWKMEDVLDAILESVRGKTFIPCFCEFTEKECKFLVIRSRLALNAIHKLGFAILHSDVRLAISISQVDLTLTQLEFIPRLVLRKRLALGYDGERKLSLKEFTTKFDISHFIYYPMNRVTNQIELIQLQSIVAWDFLTDLDLSHNRITTIDGFNLVKTTPKLKYLDLSFNRIDKVTSLLHSRELSIRALKLEGNPLCTDYTDPRHYVRVVKMVFPTLMELDGIEIHLKGDFPSFRKNYCPDEACNLVERLLAVFFPLLESPLEDRMRMESLYEKRAIMTVTYKDKLRSSPLYRFIRNLFIKSRNIEEEETDTVYGASDIIKVICKWPAWIHDYHSFTIDVIHHNNSSTVISINGLMKLTADSLAEDEPLLAFSRTLVLTTRNSSEYKIRHEMLHWEDPCDAYASTAFRTNSARSSSLSLKFEITPDKEHRDVLIEMLMKITDMKKDASEKCLIAQGWNLKSALEHFMKLLKLDDLTSLTAQLI